MEEIASNKAAYESNVERIQIMAYAKWTFEMMQLTMLFVSYRNKRHIFVDVTYKLLSLETINF